MPRHYDTAPASPNLRDTARELSQHVNVSRLFDENVPLETRLRTLERELGKTNMKPDKEFGFESVADELAFVTSLRDDPDAAAKLVKELERRISSAKPQDGEQP